MSFYRSENTKGRSQRCIESLTLKTVGRSQRIIKEFVAEVVACQHRKKERSSSLYLYDGGRDSVAAYSPRLIESVLLEPGEKEHLMQDIERFRSSRERYRRLGLPYHRGYLLYGPPCTGKTSLVSALAAKFGMSVYVVNLVEMNDRTLKNAMNWVPEDSVILFDDIDCMKASTRRLEMDGGRVKREGGVETSVAAKSTDQGGVSLSGLLMCWTGLVLQRT